MPGALVCDDTQPGGLVNFNIFNMLNSQVIVFIAKSKKCWKQEMSLELSIYIF